LRPYLEMHYLIYSIHGYRYHRYPFRFKGHEIHILTSKYAEGWVLTWNFSERCLLQTSTKVPFDPPSGYCRDCTSSTLVCTWETERSNLLQIWGTLGWLKNLPRLECRKKKKRFIWMSLKGKTMAGGYANEQRQSSK
jgi:hypothetical protein